MSTPLHRPEAPQYAYLVPHKTISENSSYSQMTHVLPQMIAENQLVRDRYPILALLAVQTLFWEKNYAPNHRKTDLESFEKLQPIAPRSFAPRLPSTLTSYLFQTHEREQPKIGQATPQASSLAHRIATVAAATMPTQKDKQTTKIGNNALPQTKSNEYSGCNTATTPIEDFFSYDSLLPLETSESIVEKEQMKNLSTTKPTDIS